MKRVTYDEWRNMTTGQRLEIIRGIYQLRGLTPEQFIPVSEEREQESAAATEESLGAGSESEKPRKGRPRKAS